MENSFVEILLLQKHLPSPVRCVSDCDIEKISEIICAFLNDKGGWIVVGIDDKGSYVGVKDDEINKELQLEITNHISPLPLVYIQKELYKDKSVILVTVVKGSLPPYSYKGRYYINREGLIIVPSPDEISCLMRDSFSVKSGWESIVNLNAEWSDLDENIMNKVYNQGLSSSRLLKSNTGLLSTLSELNLVDSYQIKNGAIALFSENTRKFIPQSRIRIQLMSKGKTANHFDDTVILEGNVFYLLKETIDYFKKRLPKQSFFIESETLRIDDYIYPIEVIDEAIERKLQIRFDYTKYGTDKKLHKTRTFRVTPYQLILHNQRYYLMAKNEHFGEGMTYYRIDHITNITIAEDKKATIISEVEGFKSGIDYKVIATAMPYMYSDAPKRVQFVADKSIIDHIIDWFGRDISIVNIDENQILVTFKVSLDAMEYWAMQYLKYVEIKEPVELRERIKENIKAASEKYI